MFTDPHRAAIHDDVRRRDHALFSHILTPELFFQAAALSGLRLVRSPLNLINLVWLAVSAARNPQLSFAFLLAVPFKALHDHEAFPASDLHRRIDSANRSRRRANRHRTSRHDPRGGGSAESVTEEAFAKARQRMPPEFWLALFFLLAERFEREHSDVVRWRHFRLLAVDGTRLNLPDYPALRDHFGTASNSTGSHNAQARLVLVQFPLARLPYAYALSPVKLGEPTLARQLLRGLRRDDLVLLDAGFLCYGLLWQIHQQASFCLRLHARLNLRVIKELGSGNDVLVEWQPKDSRGQWRREGLPKSLTLRLLTYHAAGFRPLRLLTNVVSAQAVPYEAFWGLSVSERGEVLSKGLYNNRWEIETTYGELKVGQQLQGGLRSRTAGGIEYEVAGHVLHYLLVRWLLVEAAVKAGVSPLRLSFTEALREIGLMWPAALTASAGWLAGVLRQRLRQRLGSHQVPERPGRQYPRGKKERRASKRRADARASKANKAKQGRPSRQKPGKQRSWFGNGWSLAGPPTPADATSQG